MNVECIYEYVKMRSTNQPPIVCVNRTNREGRVRGAAHSCSLGSRCPSVGMYVGVAVSRRLDTFLPAGLRHTVRVSTGSDTPFSECMFGGRNWCDRSNRPTHAQSARNAHKMHNVGEPPWRFPVPVKATTLAAYVPHLSVVGAAEPCAASPHLDYLQAPQARFGHQI